MTNISIHQQGKKDELKKKKTTKSECNGIARSEQKVKKRTDFQRERCRQIFHTRILTYVSSTTAELRNPGVEELIHCVTILEQAVTEKQELMKEIVNIDTITVN